ncbi:sulfatase-like hydrolase/transferase [Chryseolinea lacunae]|uniref:Sulfatase n=1 Tax=Chryseolinea lacunae TaxID=2801331 RepID=A0ABS1L269_9BACT|nr:sulfatase-like hydrolase/transferase [Chryseolinea lacunae]MBL0745794.1 sulfatase [Chryseolinea lacunae]
MDTVKHILFYAALSVLTIACQREKEKAKFQIKHHPNFLILMSDNHSWQDLGCYGNTLLKTPTIDQVAKDGIKFTNAFCNAPSCSPARASMLAGQQPWRLREAANLWGGFPKMELYPEILEKAGYHVGIEGKGWGPGNYEVDGWPHNPGGQSYNSFEEFYNEVDKGQPWMFWFSSRDPHRPFRRNGWESAGIDLKKINVPPYLPDTEEVRKDMADYYNEIQLFDKDVASYLALLKEVGELDNTVVIICSDNGWQMPRGLANLYDFGTKIPLIISWPSQLKGNRTIDDFVLLSDLAPTILELAGIEIPLQMDASSLTGLLKTADAAGDGDRREFAVMGRERHAFARNNGAGYPGRAIRTKDFLYIRNYNADAWPAGDPPLYGDVDAHMLQYPSPTKMYMLKHKNDERVAPLFTKAFGKRPSEELYDLKIDGYQMTNVADRPEYQAIKAGLLEQLTKELQRTNDPRQGDAPFNWDAAAYYMESDKHPKPSEDAIRELGLKEEYNYVKP